MNKIWSKDKFNKFRKNNALDKFNWKAKLVA